MLQFQDASPFHNGFGLSVTNQWALWVIKTKTLAIWKDKWFVFSVQKRFEHQPSCVSPPHAEYHPVVHDPLYSKPQTQYNSDNL